MTTASVSQSCFPIMSFLHVPGKMSQPLWLMMGTAFLVNVSRRTGAAACPFGSADASDGVDSSAHKRRRFLLTAKHTFVPWQFTDPQRLKVPEEYRRTRFVIGRLYIPDSEGKAVASLSVDLKLVAMHPTADVAVLVAKVPTSVASVAAGTASRSAVSERFDAHAELERRANAVGGGLTLAPEDPQKGSVCSVAGYRGTGLLGKLDTFDPDLLDRLSETERGQLLSSLRCVEGQQEAAVARVKIFHSKGMCRAEEGSCFHGMSGAPVLTDEKTCGGVLYGKHPDDANSVGYVPVRSFDGFVWDSVIGK